MKIYFVNEYEKPIEILHNLKVNKEKKYKRKNDFSIYLKLHPTLKPNQANIQPSTKKPIVSEFYDEIVFMNPSVNIFNCLSY